MIKFVIDHHNTKKMCKNGVKKLLFVIMYVLHQYNTHEMCDKVILQNGRKV